MPACFVMQTARVATPKYPCQQHHPHPSPNRAPASNITHMVLFGDIGKPKNIMASRGAQPAPPRDKRALSFETRVMSSTVNTKPKALNRRLRVAEEVEETFCLCRRQQPLIAEGGAPLRRWEGWRRQNSEAKRRKRTRQCYMWRSLGMEREMRLRGLVPNPKP